MTSPVNVGQVSVEVIASASALAKSLKKEVESAFKDLDLSKAIRDAVGNTKVKVPVDLDMDGLGDKVKPKRAPRVPIELDPLLSAFQAQIKRDAAALAKKINIVLPVDGDVDGLREELGAELKAVTDKLRIKVPTEPGDKAAYQSELKAQLAEVAAKLQASIPVKPDLDTTEISKQIGKAPRPKVPVEVDPLLTQFQQQVRRQVTALAKQINASIPVNADTEGLRAELGAELKAIQTSSRLAIPTEPGAKAEYEAKLRAQVAEVAARVKQHVNVEVDVDKDGKGSSALATIGGLLKGISRGIPNFGGIASGISDLGGALQKAAGSSAQLGGNLTGAFVSATGPIGLVIGLLITAAGAAAALAGAVTLVVPAMSAVAGAAAAIPAALVGVGAVVGTLALGFKGISDAFKPKAGGGGGGGGGQDPAARARQIAAAERGIEAARRGIAAADRNLAAAERGYQQAVQGLADAQKRAAQAQQAVNKARVEAKEDLEDLGRALRGTQLDERSAALAVDEALRDLNAAKLTGQIPDIQRAQLAYEQAQLTLENASDAAQDLGAEQADAAAKGVDGSDKVTAALEAQAQAQQGVKDAQDGILAAQDALASANDGVKSSVDALASAQDSLAAAQAKVASGGGGVAAQLTKLAPAAQKFVDAVKALGPAFEGLRLDVQQRLFAGLDKTITRLAKAWLEPLKQTLGSFADTFNRFFKDLGAGLSEPEFIKDLQAGAEGFRQGLATIGSSITTSLVPAFGALSRAAGPFLTQLGQEIADIVTEFSNWVLEGEKTGGLRDFFDRASVALHDIFTTGKLVAKIVGRLFQILTGSKAAGDGSPLEQFNAGLQKIADYLGDPKHQQEIRDFITTIQTAIAKVGSIVNTVSGAFAKIRTLLGGDQGGIFSSIGAAIVTGILAGIIASGQILLDGLKWAFIDSPFSLIGGLRRLLGISSPSTVAMEIGVNVVQGLIQGITGILGSLAEAAGRIATTVIGTVGSGITWLVTAGRNAVTGIGTGIRSMFGQLRTWAAGIKTTVLNALANAGSWLVATGRNTVIGLGNGIRSLYGTAFAAAAGLRTQVLNALTGSGRLLYNHGYNFVIGLYNGIASLGGWLYNKVANFIRNNVADAVSNFLQIGSPSKLAAELGSRVPEGLAVGILGGADEVASAAQKMAAAALPSLGDTSFGMDLSSAALSGSLSKAATWEASWAPGMTGDKILDALRGSIKFKFNGSVDRALSTA